jgi:fucose 4-O-acetylase-like acetyltransferase
MTLPLQASRPERLPWPDLARGIAILLVVTGHVLGGLMAGHFMAAEPWGRWWYQTLYLFHIPVFFFVSGWLFEFRCASRGPVPMKSLAATLLYPYFLWGVILWAVHLLASRTGVANQSVDLWTPLRLVYAASSGPWFLLILFLFHGLNQALGASSNKPVWLLLIAAAAFADYACFRHVEFDSTRCLFELNLLFYALGVWMASQGGLNQVRPTKTLALGMGAVLLTALAWVSHTWPEVAPWARLPLGILGLAGVLSLSLGLADMAGTQWLGWLGRHSLAIYLLHGFAPPLTRWFLARHLEVSSGVLLLVMGVAAGVLSSALVAWAVDRWQIGWVFALGNRPKTKPSGEVTCVQITE